jgi:nucleotide-binding universal stress UspA family protein
MIKKILVAFDGSESARRAFGMALEIAEPIGAEIIVASVARPPEPATMVETTAMIETATEHFEQQFSELRSQAQARGLTARTKVVVGHPAEQIIHAAAEEEADMIVMGHRGKSMIQRWLLGSVSKRVISYAPCSVLIVR